MDNNAIITVLVILSISFFILSLYTKDNFLSIVCSCTAVITVIGAIVIKLFAT